MNRIFKKSIGRLSSVFHRSTDRKPLITKKDEMTARIVSAKTLLENDIKEVPMLWGHLLPMSGIAVLSGSSDTGKSSLIRQFAISVVTKQEKFLSFGLNAKHNRVCYISTEDDEFSLSPRIKKEHIKGSFDDDYNNLRFIFDSENGLTDIERELKKNPVDCVIIDPWLDFVEGDNNLAFNTRYPLKKLRRISLDHKCLIIINHHNRKSDSEESTSKNSLLGSQSLEAKARAVLMLTRRHNDQNERLLTISKGNYIPDDLKRIQIVLSVNEGFIFEFKNTIESNPLNKSEYSNRNKENEEAIKLLLGEGFTALQIVKELPKKVQIPYKRTAVYKHLKKIDNSSTFTS